MAVAPALTVAVCGATGRQGGAVARRLLQHGCRVRALTRKPRGRPAAALAAMGAQVVAADMADRALVEDHMRALGLPLTVLRPVAFMELMTDAAFYPAVGAWSVWPRVMGETRPVYWLAVEDLGSIAAIVFANRDAWVGQDTTIAADVQNLAECRALYREVMGRPPRSLPMPLWLFDRFTRKDLTVMWRWLRVHPFEADPAATRDVLPTASTVREWLIARRRANDALPAR